MSRESLAEPYAQDVEAIARLESVPRILEVVCRTIGMGFAAVARVTEDRWIACVVRDEIQFGLDPGGELDVQTTICNGIRLSDRMVVIDNVAEDDVYSRHATPKMYGLRSYIPVPIHQRNRRFFGTLCAISTHTSASSRASVRCRTNGSARSCGISSSRF